MQRSENWPHRVWHKEYAWASFGLHASFSVSVEISHIWSGRWNVRTAWNDPTRGSVPVRPGIPTSVVVAHKSQADMSWTEQPTIRHKGWPSLICCACNVSPSLSIFECVQWSLTKNFVVECGWLCPTSGVVSPIFRVAQSEHGRFHKSIPLTRQCFNVSIFQFKKRSCLPCQWLQQSREYREFSKSISTAAFTLYVHLSGSRVLQISSENLVSWWTS